MLEWAAADLSLINEYSNYSGIRVLGVVFQIFFKSIRNRIPILNNCIVFHIVFNRDASR